MASDPAPSSQTAVAFHWPGVAGGRIMRAMSGLEEVTGGRLTPYDLVFGSGPFESEDFPSIREEARERGVDASDPERFIMLARVGALVRELLPPDADAASLVDVGRLLFQAYHFWRFGRRVYAPEQELIARLLSHPPKVGEWELTPPHPAGYLQLPRNAIWARVAGDAPAEPVDGLFWTMVGRQDPEMPPYARLDALLVLGMRADRPGFSVASVTAELPGGPGHWADVQARAGERDAGPPDFGNVLPGGELRGLHALVNEAEVLKLLSLVFWHVAAHPACVTAGEPRTIREACRGG